uniref:Ig-like domain-containing protein n=1 Tax=Oryzias sinensis TaxID=183150 RepID=A0A8C7Y8Z5_9TELE
TEFICCLYTISPNQDQLTGTEGKSVTMKCYYETDYSFPQLYWYKHDSDLQAHQFILWKGAKSYSYNELIPDKRYESRTTDTSTELTIRKLNLEDTALYYCVLERAQIYLIQFAGGLFQKAVYVSYLCKFEDKEADNPSFQFTKQRYVSVYVKLVWSRFT